MGLVPPGTTPRWTRTLVPDGAWGVFGERGLVDTVQEEQLALQVTPATTAVELRALLAGMPVQRLELFLARHPDAASVLARDYTGSGVEDPGFQGLVAAAGTGCVLSIPPEPIRVGDVAAYWDGLSPEEQDRLRLLYPYAVGNLDGVDIENRAMANRALLRDAWRPSGSPRPRSTPGRRPPRCTRTC